MTCPVCLAPFITDFKAQEDFFNKAAATGAEGISCLAAQSDCEWRKLQKQEEPRGSFAPRTKKEKKSLKLVQNTRSSPLPLEEVQGVYTSAVVTQLLSMGRTRCQHKV